MPQNDINNFQKLEIITLFLQALKRQVYQEIFSRVFLLILFIVVHFSLSPFKRVITTTDWQNYLHPYKPDTLSEISLSVIMLAILVLMIIVSLGRSHYCGPEMPISDDPEIVALPTSCTTDSNLKSQTLIVLWVGVG